MSILDRVLDSFRFGSTPQQPDIPMGRYTDVYKSKEQYDAWDKAVEAFEKEDVKTAYRQFMQYLRDEQEDNVTWQEDGDTIHFEIKQGSRKVVGTIGPEKVKAQSLIAKAESTNVGFMRRLMELNYSLKYARFGLSSDNEVAILFDSQVSDGSPLKLYHAFKEMSVNADKQDDLLIDEFKMLQSIHPLIGPSISEEEKEIKYGFLQHEIKKAFEAFDQPKPDPNQYPGGYSYMFLHLAYKLDYLVHPEGYIMEALEKIHRSYFDNSEEKNAQLKNLAMRKAFQKILDRPKEEFFKELYRTRSTFGITTPVGHERVAALIESELPNMEWYSNNQHHLLALGIPGYICGYALFNYAMPKPDKEYFYLYFQIMEAGYFRDLGFKLPHYNENGKPNKSGILRSIKQIADQNRVTYPKLSPQTKKLDFGSPILFAKTYMEMIKELDMTKSD